MRALVVEGGGRLVLREVPDAERDGECRIRVRMAGICGTDLQILEGYGGFAGIPGHEFVGSVESAAFSGDERWIGRRVVGEINVGCRACEWCATGIKEHCTDRSVVGIRGHDGAFAELVTLPAANLHDIPDTMSDEAAVFVEPTAAACRILEQLSIAERMRVAVLGDGRMGLLVGQVLKTVAKEVTLIGRHEEKLRVGRALGLNACHTDASVPSSSRFDLVVDATGRPEGLRRALEIVRPRGTVVMKSTFHGEAPIVSWPIVVDEVTVVGSRCGPFDRAIQLLASGAVRTEPLISRVAPLHEYESAFGNARRALKVMFDLR